MHERVRVYRSQHDTAHSGLVVHSTRVLFDSSIGSVSLSEPIRHMCSLATMGSEINGQRGSRLLSRLLFRNIRERENFSAIRDSTPLTRFQLSIITCWAPIRLQQVSRRASVPPPPPSYNFFGTFCFYFNIFPLLIWTIYLFFSVTCYTEYEVCPESIRLCGVPVVRVNSSLWMRNPLQSTPL